MKMKNMKFKDIISKLFWYHKKFWGNRYRLFYNNKAIELLVYHKKIYVLKDGDVICKN